MESNSEEECTITIDKYKTITQCGGRFSDTRFFDLDCGLSYVYKHNVSKEDEEKFFFKIIDKKKYLLAKLKYDI